VLAEGEARSRVLDAYERALAMPDDDPGRPAEVGLELAVLALAQPYREHPHFHPPGTSDPGPGPVTPGPRP
jgi:hypothetical protein